MPETNVEELSARLENLKEIKQKNAEKVVKIETEIDYTKKDFEKLMAEANEKGLGIKNKEDITKKLSEYKQRVIEGIEEAEKLSTVAQNELD